MYFDNNVILSIIDVICLYKIEVKGLKNNYDSNMLL